MKSNIIRLQLDNGNRLIRIEGATAEEAAAIIAERVAPNYGGQAPVPIANTEEVYAAPLLTFSKDVVPVQNGNAEEALAVPSTL